MSLAVGTTAERDVHVDTGPVWRSDLPDDLLPLTDYPVPPGALHVVADQVAHVGDWPEAYDTIAAAVAAADSGDTIVVHEGIYRESIGTVAPTKSLTFQAAPGERAWIVGTNRISSSSFTKWGNRWVASGYTFIPTCDDPSSAEYEADPGHVRRAEAVYVDGVPLRQVRSSLEVGPGTFYVNRLLGLLYIGTDPTGSSVEASAREHFANVLSPGSRIRGLGFARFASSSDPSCKPAMVLSSSDGLVIEDSAFVESSAGGVAIRDAADVVIRDSVFHANGNHGITAYKGYGIEISGNQVTGNNTERFTRRGGRGVGAGMKLTHLGWNPDRGIYARARIVDNHVADNHGRGIWCDLNCGSTLIARNIVERNDEGIFFEVSHAGDIVSNVLVGHEGPAIRVSDSHDVRILNNTTIDNAVGFYLQPDDRAVGSAAICFVAPPEAPAGASNRCVIENVVLANNLDQHLGTTAGWDLCGEAPSSMAVYTCGSAPADEMFAAMDHQAYVRTAALTTLRLIRWRLGGAPIADYTDLASFQQAHPFEANGLELVRASSVLANPGIGDYTVVDPALTSSGAPLPADLAAELGVPAAPVPRGAFAWRS